jgi:hypothetical protein
MEQHISAGRRFARWLAALYFFGDFDIARVIPDFLLVAAGRPASVIFLNDA